ncbi:hypothetical protein HanRHA438_Chr07g0318621 [Helianthus annuus]|nr:hypothetical protein HanRHA438_Chr07g0318621 [Helianthus annuus]
MFGFVSNFQGDVRLNPPTNKHTTTHLTPLAIDISYIHTVCYLQDIFSTNKNSNFHFHFNFCIYLISLNKYKNAKRKQKDILLIIHQLENRQKKNK